MKLIRWNPSPSRELRFSNDDYNRLFDSFFNRTPWTSDAPAAFEPAVDVEETPEAFVIRMDVPGVPQKSVKVSLMGDTLTIRGERTPEAPGKDASLYRRERAHGTFERSFTLAAPVRSEGVKAVYRDGVLEVSVPKAEEARVREIEVQVS